MYMNYRGANKRERALEGVADEEARNAQWMAGENSRLSQQDIAQYGDLSRRRSEALSGMLRGYTAAPDMTQQPVRQLQGDPRFDLENLGAGSGGAGNQWAAGVRSRVGNSLGLQQNVRGFDDMDAQERYQRAMAMSGYQQSGDRLGMQASEYGDLAAIRRQVLENEALVRQGQLAGSRMRAGQAGSEQMLYGGLLGLGGQAAMSYAPMGKPSAAAPYNPYNPRDYNPRK
jgi:hypothetical protein